MNCGKYAHAVQRYERAAPSIPSRFSARVRSARVRSACVRSARVRSACVRSARVRSARAWFVCLLGVCAVVSVNAHVDELSAEPRSESPREAPANSAAESQPYLQLGTVVGVNPRVAALNGTAGWKFPLYHRRSGVLYDTARVEPRVDILSNPSFTDLAFGLYVEPIALFDLTMRAGVRAFYDDLGLGAAALRRYGTTGPAARGSSYDGSDGYGWFASFAPRVKAAIGAIVATHTFTAVRFRFRSAVGDYIEEPIPLATIRTTDWVLRNDTMLLYRFDIRRSELAAVGLQWTSVVVPGADLEQQPPSHRLSTVGTVSVPVQGAIDLQAFAAAGVYLNGEPIPRTRPLALVALSLTYDLYSR